MEYWENTLNIPFVFKASKSRCYLNSDAGRYMTDSNLLPMEEVHFIKEVKDYIMKEQLYKNFKKVKKKNIKYFMYNSNLGSNTPAKNCYEVDLKSAYWEMAFKEGLLRPDIYEKAEKKNPDTGRPFIGKLTRLACIGSLARQLTIYEWDGKKETRWRENSPITAHLWDHICLKVSKVMQKAAKASKNDFMFFWVDAAFVSSKKGRDAVMKSFKKSGYDFKIKLIDKIEVIHEPTRDVIKISDSDGKREIPYSKKNRNVI